MQLLCTVDWAIIRSWSYSETLIKVNPVTNVAWPLSHTQCQTKCSVLPIMCGPLLFPEMWWLQGSTAVAGSSDPGSADCFCADGMCMCRHIVGQRVTRWRQMCGSQSAHIALPAIFRWCYHLTNESCTVNGTISWPPCVAALPWRMPLWVFSSCCFLSFLPRNGQHRG